MSSQEIIHAYRHLYRGLLHAVQFSTKGRFIARDQIRRAFREKGATYDAEGIKRTVWFLQAAARESGLEHKILKNLLRTANWRYKPKSWKYQLREWSSQSSKKVTQVAADNVKANPYMHYDMTVAMLNKTMGLCLR